MEPSEATGEASAEAQYRNMQRLLEAAIEDEEFEDDEDPEENEDEEDKDE